MMSVAALDSPLFTCSVPTMTQAVDALLYLHTPVEGGKGAVLHRDFKPENILLDEHLNAFLADTGYAKSEQLGAPAKSTRLVLTYG